MSRGAWTRKLRLTEEHLKVDSPARFGVISDTHLGRGKGEQALEPVHELFRRASVNMILHAGDVGQEWVLRDLESIAPVAAVRGNADSQPLIEALPDHVWINVGTKRILLLHGHHGKTARATARASAGPGVDLIVFGHSHQPLIEQSGDTILFNPGSATERRWNPHFGVGLIDISEAEIDPELILFDDPRHLVNVTP